ncbi:hypothetical protein AKH40_25340 [Salmonella enterica]|nr:hypothetical protein [Salmonella enterica]
MLSIRITDQKDQRANVTGSVFRCKNKKITQNGVRTDKSSNTPFFLLSKDFSKNDIDIGREMYKF